MKPFLSLLLGATLAPSFASACLNSTAHAQQRTQPASIAQDGPTASGAAARLVPGAAIRATPGIDHSRMYYDAPGDGSLWARGASYKASFGADGATYFPAFGKRAPHDVAHVLSPDSVTVGGAELSFERAAAPVRDGNRVEVDRGAFVEAYELDPESIEQTFVFSSLPGRGDLVVHIPIASELQGSETADGLEFRGDLGRVTYGRAVAIDARGERAQAATRLENGSIVIRVDAGFLATAAMPLVIDPIVTTFSIVSIAGEDFSPDVAWDGFNGVWLAVYEETFSATDTDVYAKEYTNSGTFIATAMVDFTTAAWASPRCADSGAAHLFLVVAERSSTSPHAIMGRTVQPNGTILTMSSQFDIGTSIAGNKLTPDVGGDPYPSAPSYFCVVWEQEDPAGGSGIAYRLVAPDTSMPAGPTYFGSGQLNPDVLPSVSKSNDSNNWVLAWERNELAYHGDIWAAHVHWDGTVVDGPFGVSSGSFAFDVRPSASSPLHGSQRSAIAFAHKANTSSSFDIVVAVIDGASLLQTVNVTAMENSGQQSVDQIEPSIDSDGQHFLLAYAEADSFVGYNVFVSDLYLSDAQLGVSEPHLLLQQINYDRHPRVSGAHDFSSSNRRFMAVYDTDTNSATYADVEGVLFDVFEGGTTSAFCFGDGTGTACPCSNSGASGHGCANSANSAGALLTATGTPSTVDDSIVLHVSGLPATSNCTFFQGTVANAPSVFGDGLRCAGGTVVRLRSVTASAGSANFPGSGDPHVSVQGLVPANGGVRTYQVSYRNAAPTFCTSATFNISNGMIVNWAR